MNSQEWNSLCLAVSWPFEFNSFNIKEWPLQSKGSRFQPAKAGSIRSPLVKYKPKDNVSGGTD